MMCDIEAEFHSGAVEPHSIQGSLRLSDIEDREVNELKVELIGKITYLCPTFNSGNNFMDPEKPGYTLIDCRFLNQSHSIGSTDGNESLPFRFDIPHNIVLTESMRKRLNHNHIVGNNNTSEVQSLFRLPPTFSDDNSSYLQAMLIPWKENASRARVTYSIKVTVGWHVKAGMGRLLGSNRQKSFRKDVRVIPPMTSDFNTLLPRYSGCNSKHWHREVCQIGDGFSDLCSVFKSYRAKLSLFGGTRLLLDQPMLFHLELNKKLPIGEQTLVTIDLVRSVSTKLRAGRREVEKRNNATLINRLLVQPSAEQAAGTIDSSADRLNNAHFDTSDPILKGSLSLLDDASTKQGCLSPSFSFAGLTIEYRLQIHISSGEAHFSYFTPAIVLEAELEASPPPYTTHYENPEMPTLYELLDAR